MEPRYLIISFSTRQTDDIGPVLVRTFDYLKFSVVLTLGEAPLSMLGYELLGPLPSGTPLPEALQRFYTLLI